MIRRTFSRRTLSRLSLQFRFSSDVSSNVSAGFKPINIFTEEQRDKEGNKILYKASQELTCRVMLSAASFNFLYWSYYLTSCAYYKDIVVQGINLGGDPRWGFLGAFGTGLMFYVTQQYSHHAVSKCYLTVDGERLGFQMHNIIGQPGRKIECRLGNAYMGSYNKKTNFGSSYIPLRVKGVDRNILIDESGDYYTENPSELPPLMQLLKAGEPNPVVSASSASTAMDKEKRVTLIKEQHRKNKQHKKQT